MAAILSQPQCVNKSVVVVDTQESSDDPAPVPTSAPAPKVVAPAAGPRRKRPAPVPYQPPAARRNQGDFYLSAVKMNDFPQCALGGTTVISKILSPNTFRIN